MKKETSLLNLRVAEMQSELHRFRQQERHRSSELSDSKIPIQQLLASFRKRYLGKRPSSPSLSSPSSFLSNELKALPEHISAIILNGRVHPFIFIGSRHNYIFTGSLLSAH